ncbi:MAG: hypothetical protein GXP33_07585 [Spirochaetes bacterium]|nr:hypothetical protein [Spirochaetota bacterium]
MKVCHFCGSVIDDGIRVYRSSVCPSCSGDLKICCNCRFYSKGSHWDCLESITEPVPEKDRANFCEFFQYREIKSLSGRGYPGNTDPGSRAAETQKTDRKQQAKNDFDKLFGD